MPSGEEVASSEKAKGREAEEEEEVEKEEGEDQKKMVGKVKRGHCKSVYFEEGRGCERKGKQEKARRTKVRQTLGKSGRWLFLLLLLGQNWPCVNAAAEGLHKRREMMESLQHQEVQVKESRRAEEIPQKWKQPKGEDRTEMKKEAKLLRCTSGSAWRKRST